MAVNKWLHLIVFALFGSFTFIGGHWMAKKELSSISHVKRWRWYSFTRNCYNIYHMRCHFFFFFYNFIPRWQQIGSANSILIYKAVLLLDHLEGTGLLLFCCCFLVCIQIIVNYFIIVLHVLDWIWNVEIDETHAIYQSKSGLVYVLQFGICSKIEHHKCAATLQVGYNEGRSTFIFWSCYIPTSII